MCVPVSFVCPPPSSRRLVVPTFFARRFARYLPKLGGDDRRTTDRRVHAATACSLRFTSSGAAAPAARARLRESLRATRPVQQRHARRDQGGLPLCRWPASTAQAADWPRLALVSLSQRQTALQPARPRPVSLSQRQTLVRALRALWGDLALRALWGVSWPCLSHLGFHIGVPAQGAATAPRPASGGCCSIGTLQAAARRAPASTRHGTHGHRSRLCERAPCGRRGI